MATTSAACRQHVDQEHEYLRTQVDPLLMPLIEALLLHQPASIYDFIAKFLDGAELGSMKHAGDATTKSAKARRHRMVEFMSSSVLPVMDDLTQRILQDKPANAKAFLRDIVQTRLLNNQNEPPAAAFDLATQQYRVGDRVDCRFKGRPKYLPGVVESIDEGGLCTIRYDSGKVEEHIHPILLRRPLDQPEAEDAIEVSKTPRREIKPVILMLGLDGSGKSTFLSTLQGDLDKDIPPTAGFSSVTFQLANGSATFYDLGGGPTIRALWKEYYADAHGVIYMVDASDVGRIQEASKHLEDAMAHPMLHGKPVLIYANKMDQSTALAESDFAQRMNVASYLDKKVLQSVTKANANGNLVDDRLEGGLRWILSRVEDEYDALGVRVTADRATMKKEAAAAWQAQKERVWAYKEERERIAMLVEDSPANQAAFAPAKAPAKQQSSDVPMCSSCASQPAVTKCAASKWMPVCGDCADRLKKK